MKLRRSLSADGETERPKKEAAGSHAEDPAAEKRGKERRCVERKMPSLPPRGANREEDIPLRMRDEIQMSGHLDIIINFF